MSMYQTAMKNYIATQYTGKLLYVGALTALGSGGSTAGTEPTGGSPAYARVAASWGSASAGAATGTGSAINIPASTTIIGAGLYDVSSGTPTDYDQTSLTSQAFASQGVYTVTPTITFT